MYHTGQIQFIPEATIFLACAIVFVFTAFAFVIIILFSRIIKTHGARRYKKLREEFQKTLNALIILEHSKENISHFSLAFYLKDLRQKIRTSFGKQLLIDLLIANKQNLTGSSAWQKKFPRNFILNVNYSLIHQELGQYVWINSSLIGIRKKF